MVTVTKKPRRARPAGEVRPEVQKKPAAPEKATEHPAVTKARARIAEIIKKTSDGKSALAIGLVLALVNQETGNHAAANIIIDEHGLDKKFGLEKFVP